MTLFQRRIVLQVEGRDLSALRISFDVTRNLKNNPSTAEVSVYNLSADTRRALSNSSSTGARIVLLAGYQDETPHAIFIGRLRSINHSQASADWITRVSSGDGTPRGLRVSSSFAAGTDIGSVLKKVATGLGAGGIGKGNIDLVAKRLTGRTVGRGGLALSGSPEVALSAILDQLDLEWSIQDDQLQILERGKARQVRAAVVSPDTGLIGSPEVLERGRAKARSLIAPGLTPGFLISLESRDLQGFYRIDSGRYVGDTYGPQWSVAMELRPVK